MLEHPRDTADHLPRCELDGCHRLSWALLGKQRLTLRRLGVLVASEDLRGRTDDAIGGVELYDSRGRTTNEEGARERKRRGGEESLDGGLGEGVEREDSYRPDEQSR